MRTWISGVGDLPAGVGLFGGVEDAFPRVGGDGMLEAEVAHGRLGEGNSQEAVHVFPVDVLAHATDASVIGFDH